MNQKMTGKQKVVKGFDIEAFARGADPTEPEVTAAPQPKPATKSKSESRAGEVRKLTPKKVTEPLSERLQIKLTAGEMKKMKDAAGLVPLSVYTRKFLQDKGLI